MSAASREALAADMRDERMKECAGEMYEALKGMLAHEHAACVRSGLHLPLEAQIARDIIAKVEGHGWK